MPSPSALSIHGNYAHPLPATMTCVPLVFRPSAHPPAVLVYAQSARLAHPSFAHTCLCTYPHARPKLARTPTLICLPTYVCCTHSHVHMLCPSTSAVRTLHLWTHEYPCMLYARTCSYPRTVCLPMYAVCMHTVPMPTRPLPRAPTLVCCRPHCRAVAHYRAVCMVVRSHQ